MNAAPSDQASPAPAKRCVLIVDDEDSVRSVTKRMLQLNGFEVLVARDGLEGIELFSRDGDRIEIVLLDMTMPRMGGDEVLKQIRIAKPLVRVVLMSGYSRREAGPLLGDGSITGFLQKPFTFAQLKEQLRLLPESAA